jgi:hypothetical protein
MKKAARPIVVRFECIGKPAALRVCPDLRGTLRPSVVRGMERSFFLCPPK